MSVEGVGPWLRPTAAVSGGFRGLQLYLEDFDNWMTIADDATVAAAFDTIAIDTDGFASSGTHTFSFVTVPIGSALVVPAGLAGYYRISSNIAYTHGPGAQTVDFGISAGPVVNDQEEAFLSGGVFKATTVGTRLGAMASATPAVVLLAEGDVVWVLIDNIGPEMTVFSRSWFLCEYLGA